jgi:hypothetical protein
VTERRDWGGRRPGAGRKPLPPGVRKVRRSVSLEERHWRWLDGTGNASAALRDLVEAALGTDRLGVARDSSPPRAGPGRRVGRPTEWRGHDEVYGSLRQRT